MEGPSIDTQAIKKKKKGHEQPICSSLKGGYCKFTKSVLESVLISKIQKRSKREQVAR